MNPYEVLGVSPETHPDEIKKKYRKLANAHHPDKHQHADPAVKEEHAKKFAEIAAAYEILSDPEKKAYYDKHGCSSDQMGISPVESKVLAVWKELLQHIGPQSAKTVNVLHKVRSALLDETYRETVTQQELRSKIKDFESLLPRYQKVGGGRNIFAQVLTESIKGFHEVIDASKANEQLCKDAVQFLRDYEYKVDEPVSPTRFTITGGSFFNTLGG